jgi:hypothetical protein
VYPPLVTVTWVSQYNWKSFIYSIQKAISDQMELKTIEADESVSKELIIRMWFLWFSLNKEYAYARGDGRRLPC